MSLSEGRLHGCTACGGRPAAGLTARALGADDGGLTGLGPWLGGSLQGDNGLSFGLQRLQQRQNTSDRSTQNAHRGINQIGDRMALVDSIKTEATRIYQQARAGMACRVGRRALACRAALGCTPGDWVLQLCSLWVP